MTDGICAAAIDSCVDSGVDSNIMNAEKDDQETTQTVSWMEDGLIRST